MESSLDPLSGTTNNNIASLYDSEGGRGCRSKRKQSNPTFCPVCQCTLRSSDVDQHLHCELEKLQKISKARSGRLCGIAPSCTTTSSGNGPNSSATSSPSPTQSPQPNGEHYRKYQQVRSNRQSRQKLKYKRRKLNEGQPTSANTGERSLPGPSTAVKTGPGRNVELQCPVCYRIKSRTEITMHVDRCLARSERRNKRKRRDASTADSAESSNDDSTTDYEECGAEEADVDNDEIDVEGYEEYEWAGQSRVRVTSLIPGGICSLFPTSANSEDVDEDLVVDDEDRFGPAQYTELDMIQCSSDTRRERREETLRRAVLSPIMPVTTQQFGPQRSKSAEPQASEDHETDRLGNRCNSDPPPVITANSSTVQTEDAPDTSAVSEEVHAYPVAITDAAANGSSSTTSFESVAAPSPPPLDMSVPAAAHSEVPDFETTPILQPPNATTTESYADNNSIITTGSIEAEMMLPVVMLEFLPRTPYIVPSLSAMAQDAARRARIAGANPTPSTSARERKPINHLVIQSLFARIRELETRLDGDVYKCLICMERYRTPVISTTCWHVHCEECWLRTLGAKKLCPQCNAITTPNDLRKIFI